MAEQSSKALVVIRRKQVEQRTGLPRSTLYERIAQGKFPRQIKLGTRAVGWVESEVEAWLASQIECSRRAPYRGASR